RSPATSARSRSSTTWSTGTTSPTCSAASAIPTPRPATPTRPGRRGGGRSSPTRSSVFPPPSCAPGWTRRSRPARRSGPELHIHGSPQVPSGLRGDAGRVSASNISRGYPVSTYVFDQAWQKEHDRLSALESLYDRASRRHLGALGVGDGWRCLEVGAG